MRFIITLLIAGLFTSQAFAQKDTAKVKITSRYSLFNAVPKDKMKEMKTDRPDATENAYTVEAGHFQVETDLFKHFSNKKSDVISSGNIFNLGNYKLGLTERMDIQLVLPAYVNNITRERSSNKIISRTAGFDDITMRLKYNIWGYAGGRTALAILPFLSFPTSSFSNNGIQGGIIFPFALELKEGLDFGTQLGMEIVNEDDNYHSNFLYSFTFGKSISNKVNMFAEAFASYSPYSNNTEIFVDGGIIFSFSKNFNIDAGFNYGITKNADKIFFTGLSFRL